MSVPQVVEQMKRSAVLSLDGVYRYRLGRRWGDGPSVTWVMLNPSTADADVDDPTIRRCIAFTESWNFHALTVVNHFAYRATDPKALRQVEDAIGPANWRHVREAITEGQFTVAAWGAHARSMPWWRYTPDVADLAAKANRPLRCLGTTKDGSPRHPLYLRADTPLASWPAT